MPNRKATRNAYYFFVQEKIPELRRRGLPVARVADAIPYCSADWAVRQEGMREAGQLGKWEAEVGGKKASDPLALVGGRESPLCPAQGGLTRGQGARASQLLLFRSLPSIFPSS